MDIIIRNLPAKTVAQLDALAKKSVTSRENYLRKLLIETTEQNERRQLHEHYEELAKEEVLRLTAAIEKNTTILEKFQKEGLQWN